MKSDQLKYMFRLADIAYVLCSSFHNNGQGRIEQCQTRKENIRYFKAILSVPPIILIEPNIVC
jgi:hypothetical protein